MIQRGIWEIVWKLGIKARKVPDSNPALRLPTHPSYQTPGNPRVELDLSQW